MSLFSTALIWQTEMRSFTTNTIDQKSSSTAERLEPAAAVVFSTHPEYGLTLHTRNITA